MWSVNTDDGKQLPVLLEQAKANGIDVVEIIADKAYSGKYNLEIMKTETISPVVPLHPVVQGGGERQEGFEYNKDADFVVCPAGEHSTRRAIQGSKKDGRSRSSIILTLRNVKLVLCKMAATSQELKASLTPYE